MVQSVALAYPHLFSPIQIGSKRVRNRISYSTHSTNYAEGPSGLPSERLVAYHRDRAPSGVGLGVIEGARVLPNSSLPSSRGLGTFGRDTLPMFRVLMEETHRYDIRHDYSDTATAHGAPDAQHGQSAPALRALGDSIRTELRSSACEGPP